MKGADGYIAGSGREKREDGSESLPGSRRKNRDLYRRFIFVKNRTAYMSIKCGDKPGEGRYVCKKCGKSITIAKDEAIYPCPICQFCEYRQG